MHVFLTQNCHFQVYAKNVRKKSGEYRLEFRTGLEHDETSDLKSAMPRYNSPAIYPQNWFSSVPTFCYPGVAFCSKTAILGPGSGSESGETYEADSRIELGFVGEKAKKARWKPSSFEIQMVEYSAIFGNPAISQ